MRLAGAGMIVSLALAAAAAPASAQASGPPRPDAETAAQAVLDADAIEAARDASVLLEAPSGINPMEAIVQAGGLLSRVGTGGAAPADAGGGGGAGGVGGAGGERGGLTVALNIMVLLTVITLVPSVLLMCTCFVRILIVLSLLRQAIGTQTLPPAQVITGLALFMTVAVMAPTAERVWAEAVVPWREGEVASYDELWERAKQPLRDYMFDQIEATGNWSSVYAMLNYRGVDTSEPWKLTRADVDMTALVPAYMLSELKVGFLMGFRLYLPFLVIDMVIAIILISMGMMMLPPVLISLPFKLLLFVLVDGWTLVVGSLLESFVREGQMERLSAQPAAAAATLTLLLCCRVRRDRTAPGGPGGEARDG